MQVVITYDDGTGEVVRARLEGDVVSFAQGWIPGILVDEPERCYFMSDYFGCAINEGHEREGVVRPEPGDVDPDTGKPDWMGFTWKLLGNEPDECRQKMWRWIDRVGGAFDPEKTAADYLHGDLLHVLDEAEMPAYDRDRQCWITYLADPRTEAVALLREKGFDPPADWEIAPGARP